MDTTLEASVQHHSLKAEHPGETEASKSQSDEKHNTLALRVSNWQTAAVINSKTHGLMTVGRDRKKKGTFEVEVASSEPETTLE